MQVSEVKTVKYKFTNNPSTEMVERALTDSKERGVPADVAPTFYGTTIVFSWVSSKEFFD